ncbi:MAG: hypothetical protein DMG97_26855 [Acidobacteria bacterium]|nr:MAG: hypothetical protein DMG97_26855 [Acidobacteriota bacterium]
MQSPAATKATPPGATSALTPRMGVKAFLKRLSVAVTLTLVLLGLGEGASYLVLKSQETRKTTAKIDSPIYRGQSWAATYWQELESAEKVQYQPFVVWRRAPFTGSAINIDAEGVRRTTHSYCDGNAYTIWMFGNSVLWGSGDPDWGTIPSYLAAKYENAGRKVCVKNYGEKNWVSTQELLELMLQLKQAQRKPDLVIFYDGITDTWLPFQSAGPDVHGNFNQIKSIFEQAEMSKSMGFEYLLRSNTVRFLKLVSQRIQAQGKGGARPLTETQASAMASTVVTNYFHNMELVEVLGQHYGFRCAFFWEPTLLTGWSTLVSPQVAPWIPQQEPGSRPVFAATYKLMRNFHRKDFYYFGDLLNDSPATVWLDNGHTSPDANRSLAEKMFQTFAGAAGGVKDAAIARARGLSELYEP